MDSITHVVLGAALGEVTLGKKLGYKAALIGALADTVPDFDVFANFLTHNEIFKLQIHRSYSHAMFTHLLLVFPLAWLTHIAFKRKIPYRQWCLLWILGLTTHALLDCCTTYGTQYLLPFTHTLVGFNNISVVDVFFTLPFMVFVIAAQFVKKDNPLRVKTAWAGLSYAMLYICLTVVNKYYVHRHFDNELQRQRIQTSALYTSPSLFNNFLWCAIATTNDSVWLGEYSILQKTTAVHWVSYPRNMPLVQNHPDKHDMEVLQWFSQGKYFAMQSGDTLKFFNVKWGRSDFRETEAEKAVFMNFLVYPGKEGWLSAVREPHMTGEQFRSAWNALWRRMLEDNYANR
jgi:inner membrane protein